MDCILTGRETERGGAGEREVERKGGRQRSQERGKMKGGLTVGSVLIAKICEL